MTEVIERPELNRFELQVGDAPACAYYRVEGDNLVLLHTEVPFELSGQGIASRPAEGVFALARSSGRKLVLRCSFMARWASLHPEQQDIVVG